MSNSFTEFKIPCPHCGHLTLKGAIDDDGLPKYLDCHECLWSDMDTRRCKERARELNEQRRALADPAERKKRAEERRRKNNEVVTNAFGLKKGKRK